MQRTLRVDRSNGAGARGSGTGVVGVHILGDANALVIIGASSCWLVVTVGVSRRIHGGTLEMANLL
jgi:hypothetical protein